MNQKVAQVRFMEVACVTCCLPIALMHACRHLILKYLEMVVKCHVNLKAKISLPHTILVLAKHVHIKESDIQVSYVGPRTKLTNL